MASLAHVSVDGKIWSKTKVCSVTGELYQIKLPLERVAEWQNGELIQNAFPELTPNQREFLMTGMTPAEWKKLFGEN